MLIEVRVDAAEGGEGTETIRAIGASLETRARLEMHTREQGSLKWGRARAASELLDQQPVPVENGLVLIQGSLNSGAVFPHPSTKTSILLL